MDQHQLTYRIAAIDDLEAIVKIYSEDKFGAAREYFQTPLPQSYVDAFHNINADKNHELTVVELNNEIVGTFQLTYLVYLSYKGGTRLLVENVYVKAGHTGKGIGKQMFNYIIEKAKSKKIHLIQLTTNKGRPDSKRFYESLGFVATHEGMKLHL